MLRSKVGVRAVTQTAHGNVQVLFVSSEGICKVMALDSKQPVLLNGVFEMVINVSAQLPSLLPTGCGQLDLFSISVPYFEVVTNSNSGFLRQKGHK